MYPAWYQNTIFYEVYVRAIKDVDERDGNLKRIEDVLVNLKIDIFQAHLKGIFIFTVLQEVLLKRLDHLLWADPWYSKLVIS
jgi:hypothetical protein